MSGRDKDSVLLNTMFECMMIKPYGNWVFSWGSARSNLDNKPTHLKKMLKKTLDKDTYKAFWTYGNCRKVIDQLSHQGQIMCNGRSIDLDDFERLYRSYSEMMGRKVRKAIVRSWFELYRQFKDEHLLMLNTFGVESRRLILETVEREEDVTFITVNYDAWGDNDRAKFAEQYTMPAGLEEPSSPSVKASQTPAESTALSVPGHSEPIRGSFTMQVSSPRPSTAAAGDGSYGFTPNARQQDPKAMAEGDADDDGIRRVSMMPLAAEGHRPSMLPLRPDSAKKKRSSVGDLDAVSESSGSSVVRPSLTFSTPAQGRSALAPPGGGSMSERTSRLDPGNLRLSSTTPRSSEVVSTPTRGSRAVSTAWGEERCRLRDQLASARRQATALSQDVMQLKQDLSSVSNGVQGLECEFYRTVPQRPPPRRPMFA